MKTLEQAIEDCKKVSEYAKANGLPLYLGEVVKLARKNSDGEIYIDQPAGTHRFFKTQTLMWSE